MRRQSGQIAIGLAVGFTAILAAFAWTFTSAMITREKIQLQQTTDLAALAAARVQKDHLNLIRDYNSRIEAAYLAAQAILTGYSAISPCEMEVLGNPSFPTAPEQIGEAARRAGSATAFDCNSACQSLDQKRRDQVIDQYERVRDFYVNRIGEILRQSPSLGASAAVDTFMTPRNLPYRLYRKLQERLGSLFSRSDAKRQYEQGALAENLKLATSQPDPALFRSQGEVRSFVYMKKFYMPSVLFPVCSPGTPTWVPIPSPTTVKVVRDGPRNSSFFVGAAYTPPANEEIEKWSLWVKDPTTGKPARDIRGHKIPLFPEARKPEERTPMFAFSLAKPYGGSYPGYGPTQVGEKFKGAKLAGLADTRELGERFPLEQTFGMTDMFGRRNEDVTLRTEEFLH